MFAPRPGNTQAIVLATRHGDVLARLARDASA